MAKLVYLRFQPVTLRENFPGGLQETIIYNGYDTGIFRYYEVFGNSSPGDKDYLEFTVSQMTFAAQDTAQQGTVNTETGTQPYQLWMTRSVADNFVIPTAPAPDLQVRLNAVSPTTVATDGKLDFDILVTNAGNAGSNSAPSRLLYFEGQGHYHLRHVAHRF